MDIKFELCKPQTLKTLKCEEESFFHTQLLQFDNIYIFVIMTLYNMSCVLPTKLYLPNFKTW